MPLAPVPVPRRFEGRSVVVTGAGTGFGAEIAVRAAQEGARAVGVHYRSSVEGAKRTADRVAAEGSTPVLLQADIVDWEQIKAMADAAFERLDGVDVLVNNVGDVAREQMSWRDITEESIDHVLGRRHQGHDALRPRVRRADAGAGPRQHREHRVDRHRPRQRAGAAVRRGEVRASWA